jgi:hypothetical protein
MIIAKMIRLGFIEKIESENEYHPNFIIIITEDGIKIHQNQTLQTLASSAFYSYHTHLLNKEVKVLSKRMFWLTVVSVVVTVLSIVL